MKICYISRNYNTLGSAGNKAKTDIELILSEQGYRNAGRPQTRHWGKVKSFLSTLSSAMKAPFSLRKGDILVIQYPMRKYYNFECRAAHLRGCKVVTLIHDLGSFRHRKLTPAQETARLSKSDYVIAHNETMKQYLIDNGIKVPVESLEIFDYISTVNADENKPKELPYKIMYAGALNRRKNSFLYEIGSFIENYRMNLYGGGFSTEGLKNPDKFDYKGFVDSDDLIVGAEEHFGLVWDGDSVSTCTGTWGEYLRYNNPHKTSLYIRCLLPVIIWDKAAMASFVKKHNIGICIDSMENLDSILKNITPEQYAEMKRNVVELSKKLAEGHYTLQAIHKAARYLS